MLCDPGPGPGLEWCVQVVHFLCLPSFSSYLEQTQGGSGELWRWVLRWVVDVHRCVDVAILSMWDVCACVCKSKSDLGLWLLLPGLDCHKGSKHIEVLAVN